MNEALKFYDIEDIKQKNVYGRLCRQKSPLPLLFNGSGVEITVTGSNLYIEIDSDCDFHEPWIAYEINGAFMSRQMLLPGSHSICLFRNMEPSTPKTVKFYRELQAMSEDDCCRILIKGFRTDGSFLDVPKRSCRIEFIGDSITSGEGTYGAYEDMDWLAMYMGASRNYAYMTARALNADYHLISQGGWGVYSGWDNDIRHNIPSVYEKVCGLSTGPNNEAMGTQEDYDFSWQPDAIVVNLGTNDRSAFRQPPFTDPDTGMVHKLHQDEHENLLEEDARKVEDATVSFLRMLRKHNPSAHIVWAYGMLGYDLTLLLTKAINRYIDETGDRNVRFINLPNTTQEGFGSHMHPGIVSHEAASKVLIEYLKEVLNK